MSTPDPKIDPKTLTHDQLRLELAHRLSEADMGGVKVLVEWAKQLTGEQKLRLIETLAYAPGNAHSSR